MSLLTHLLGLSLCLVYYSTLVHPFPFSSSSILMLITSLVENTSTQGLPVEHGLSLHIRLDQGRQVLFDMGQRILFVENAQRLGIHLEEVDLAVLSHGHYDHGGGLRAFFRLNSHAPMYVQRTAFEPHYSQRAEGLKSIGLDQDLLTESRFRWVDQMERIDEQLTLFADVQGTCFNPPGNRLLFGPEPNQHDAFVHEQNLLICEGNQVVLFASCAHAGIVNILRRAHQVAGRSITHVFAGMHLVKTGMNPAAENQFIRALARELLTYPNIHFYTMHCTGTEAYQVLREEMGTSLDYLACGDQVHI